MNALNTITISAFLAALTQLDSPLPTELQDALHDIGKDFTSSVFNLDGLATKLNTLAKRHTLLNRSYREARLVLQSSAGERLRFATPDGDNAVQSNETEIIGLAIEVFNAFDSVALTKRAATGSDVIGQVLVQLQGGTSLGAESNQLENVEIPQTHRAYNILSLVDEVCITPNGGQKVYDLIHPELLAGSSVELDFTGVEILAPPFLNFAVGQLLKDIQSKDLDRLLKVSHLIPLGMRIMKRVVENAKEYYSDDKIRRAVDEVIMSQAVGF